MGNHRREHWSKQMKRCQHCNGTNVKLRRQFARSGAVQIGFFCLDCIRPHNALKAFVKHELVKKWITDGRLPVASIEEIPIIIDYRDRRCEVCGTIGAEYHHWLPQAFADVVENHSAWPGSYLCLPCHRLWHDTVTPYLFGKNWRDKYEASTIKQPSGAGQD
jgi:hypothetical protein